MAETKKKPVKKAKTTKKKTKKIEKKADQGSQPVVEKADKSSQASNLALDEVKIKIVSILKTWLQDQPEDHGKSELELYQDLQDFLHSSIKDRMLKILMKSQAELELRAALTFNLVGAYLRQSGFKGFAMWFFHLSESTTSLVLSLGRALAVSPFVKVPTWTHWETVLDGINEGFQAERATIDTFEKLHKYLNGQEGEEIRDKKLAIIDKFEALLKTFKEASNPEDLNKIDQDLKYFYKS